MKVIIIILVCFATVSEARQRYEANWESLDKRPLPTWFDKGKIGIFIHWGVFSVPSFSSEWFWNCWNSGNKDCVDFVRDNYRPNWTYADFARDFTAEFYNATEWAKLFEDVGAAYVVFVSKHHEGYCNWPSNHSFNWNSMAVGPRKDLVGELADAIRKYTKIHFGVYHSMFEWYNPLYMRDKANGFRTREFVDSKTLPELIELVNTYKPDVIWSDGEWEASSSYWRSPEFIAWLYNDSPVRDTVVVNDRWGNETRCKHGGFWDCTDAYNPGILQKRKWENNFPLDKSSWGYRRTMSIDQIHSMESLLTLLARTISCGGNFLLNVGPTKSGRIVPVFEERLRQFGSWMQVNGEAVYETFPWKHQNDSVNENLWYVARNMDGKMNVYAFVLEWPANGSLIMADLQNSPQLKITMIGYKGRKAFTWNSRPQGGVVANLPSLTPAEIPCKWAWVLKLENAM